MVNGSAGAPGLTRAGFEPEKDRNAKHGTSALLLALIFLLHSTNRSALHCSMPSKHWSCAALYTD